MAARYLAEILGPEALAAQQRAYGRSYRVPEASEPDRLGPAEIEHITARDSFYLSSVTSRGWPYVQHRGGPAGFLRVLDEHTLGCADLRGNRQLVTAGNLVANDRVALMLVDYPRRARLKILGHGRLVDARDDPALADALSPSAALRPRVERLLIVDVVGFDWNCSSYLTPRYTEAEIERATAPLRQRIADLEAQLRRR